MALYHADKFRQTSDEIQITFTRHQGAGCLAASVFVVSTAALLVCSGVIAADTSHWMAFAILVPFSAAWVAVTAGMVIPRFFRDVFRFTSQGVIHSRRFFRHRRTWRVPLEDLIGFRGPDSYAAMDGPRLGVEVVTTGRNLFFNPRLHGIDDRHLVQRLNARLEELRQRTAVPRPPDGSLADCRECTRPWDSRWSEATEPGGVVLEQQGRLWLRWLATLLAVSLLFNGMAGIFVLGLTHPDSALTRPPEARVWWSLLAATVPVSAIGLALLTIFCALLAEPFRVTQWRITETGSTRRIRSLGLQWTWRFADTAVRQLEITERRASRWNEDDQPRSESAGVPSRTRFGLVARDDTGKKIWTIHRLSLGDALWIKGRIQTYLEPIQIPTPVSTSRPLLSTKTTTSVPGQEVELALCVECLEPLSEQTSQQVVGLTCPNCGALQPQIAQPERDTEAWFSPPITPAPGRGALLLEGIETERSDPDGLRLSFLLVPPGPVRDHAPWMIASWGIVLAAFMLWMTRKDWAQTQEGPFQFISILMAVAVVLQTLAIALVIVRGRTTVDLCRNGLLVRWGWGILSKSCWTPLDQIDGLRVERATVEHRQWNRYRRYQRQAGAVIVRGRPWIISPFRNRSFSTTVLRLIHDKLAELRSANS